MDDDDEPQHKPKPQPSRSPKQEATPPRKSTSGLSELMRQARDGDWDDEEPSSEFVPAPPEPPDDDIKARFQDVLRCQADLSSSIDRLCSAITVSPFREIGPGHNKGPLLIEELDAESTHLLKLLQNKGPRPPPADRAPIVEKTKKIFGLAIRITTWLGILAIEGAQFGAGEVAKHLTEPLWADVSDRIYDLFNEIVAWMSLLPPM
jgi:hypothetical protein